MTSIAPPCVIDVEASGFGKGSYPIEVGYALPDGASWCTLVRPADDWQHWDPGAAKVHGISRELLAKHGRSPREVAEHLNQVLAGQTVFTDAWGNDLSWLSRLHDEAEVPLRYRLASVVQLVPPDDLPSLDPLRRAAYDELGIRRHRASSDARALQWALGQLIAPPLAPQDH